MNAWSTDKIAVTGLVLALLVSIIAGIWTGNGVELQTTIASGLVGYIGRAMQEKISDYLHHDNENGGSHASQVLSKVETTAAQAQVALNAVENIAKAINPEKKGQ